MKIYFIRHGESEANILQELSNLAEKHPLTDYGRQQTKFLAQNLKGVPFHQIFTSPLLRARETAQILSDELTIPFEITDALREGDCGILEGRSDKAAWAIFDQVHNAWWAGDMNVRVKGGESFNDMEARFVPFIRKIANEDRGDVLLVGHGSLYRFMLPKMLVNIDAAWAAPIPIGNTAFIIAENTDAGMICVEWCGEHP